MEHLLGKKLPHGERVGESWEIVDREEAQSVVHEGPLRGTTLHELWTERRAEIFGPGLADTPRFPLLCKILDAQERLSVQVHPPASVAGRLRGEPKTEMWFILDAQLDSDLYAGLRRGVTRDGFQTALENGTVAEQIHSFPVKTGDSMFIPSGRIHAIGAGNLIIEVQQNSDTTYRVFDWNRLGLDGQPRELHVAASMESIDFADFEPQPTPARSEVVAECAFFRVERWVLDRARAHAGPGFAIFSVIAGHVRCDDREFTRGAFFLLPAEPTAREIHPLTADAAVLRTTVPGQS